MTKIGMWANLDAPSLRHAIELENRTQVLGCFTGNMTEAGEAFREKRDPVWKPMSARATRVRGPALTR